MNIRKAHPKDAEAISTIAFQTFPMACPAGTSEDELLHYCNENLTTTHFETYTSSKDHDVNVLETDGQIIGFTVVRYNPPSVNLRIADGIPELQRCYVIARYHGSDAGQRLLSYTLANFFGAIRLSVNEENSRAIKFYQRNGFVTVGETSFQCGTDTHRDLIMLRMLSRDLQFIT